MYYGVDDNGFIVASPENDVLDTSISDLYPESASDLPVSDMQKEANSFLPSVSSGDPVLPDTPQGDAPALLPEGVVYSVGNVVSYDDLIDALAAVTEYNVYPNANAVAVFTQVLNGVDEDVGYFILSGPDTYQTHLYYSPDFTVSGNTLTLTGSVTHCYYYQYRPSSSSAWQYTYQVNTVGDTSTTLGGHLVYTNMAEGYPDVIPYKSKESYHVLYSVPLLILFGFLAARFAIRRSHV